MSYVWVEGGNLKTSGMYCVWDGVSSCVTRLVAVSGGNLVTVSSSTAAGAPCPSVTAVEYSSGNLTAANLTWACTAA